MQRSSRIIAFPLIAVVMAVSRPALARDPLYVQQCADLQGVRFSVDERIGGCTAMIQSGRYRGRNLSWAYNYRGVAWAYKGDNDHAIADYNAAIRLDPKNADAYYYRGNTWAAKGDRDRAIADYDAVIRLDPKIAEAYNNRGVAWRGKGDRDRAIADYDAAIRLNPKYADAFFNRGNAYAEKGQHDRAIEDYSKTIRLNPKHAAAFFKRGNSYGKKGQLDLAIEDYGQAIKFNPRSEEVFIYRGVAYVTKGRYNQAIDDFNQAIKLNPKFALAFYDRGAVYMIKGQNDRAAADYRAALNLDPHLTLAKDALKRLNANLSAAKNAPIAGGAARKEVAPRKGSFAAEVLEKLEATQEYRTLIAYSAGKKKNDPAWASSAQGRAVEAYLVALRSDAIATRVVDTDKAKYLQTTIDGVTTIDKKVGVAEMKRDADYRRFTASSVALHIVASAKLQAFLATLGKDAGAKR